MSQLSRWFHNFVDQAHNLLHGISGAFISRFIDGEPSPHVTQSVWYTVIINGRAYETIRSTTDDERTAEISAQHESYIAKIQAYISEIFKILLFVRLGLESARFAITIKDIISKKTAISIESIGKLAWSALLISFIVCAIVVSLPIFLLALSTLNFLKNISLTFYFAREWVKLNHMQEVLKHRSSIQFFSYTVNTVISALIMISSTLLLIAPTVFILPIVTLFLAAFGLSVIKLVADWFIDTPTPSQETIVDLSLSDDASPHILITDDMDLSLDSEQKLDAFFTRMQTLTNITSPLSIENSETSHTGEEDAQPDNEQKEGDLTITEKDERISLVTELKNIYTEIKSHKKSSGTSETLDTHYNQVKTRLTTLRTTSANNGSLYCHASFFEPLKRNLLLRTLNAVADFNENTLHGDDYRKILLSERGLTGV